MAIAHLSSFLDDLRGRIGNSLTLRRYGDKLVLSKMPVFRKPASPKQQQARKAFQQAMAYAGSALQDPQRTAIYRELAARRGISPIAIAVRDYLRPPQIEHVQLQQEGDITYIQIQTRDVIRVCEVRLQLYDAQGTLLESGKASYLAGDDRWHYTLQQPLGQHYRLRAEAYDLAGNCVNYELVC